jgi:orotidine-5'-phosphate decarboxylase
MTESARERIIVPLDVATEEEALDLVLQLKEHVGLFKIGLELLNSEGIDIVEKVSKLGGEVFLDTKFKDIPNTVAGASRAVTRLGVRMFNVHTMGGVKMMETAANAARQEAARLGLRCPLVLGVTILTSINQEMMNQQLRILGTVEDQVVHLARIAELSGLDGVISSPHEIEAVRRNVSRNMLVITPGVRPKWAAVNDHERIMTPSEAILRGASYLVIGRPITKPPSAVGTPLEAAKRIADEISVALARREG